MGRHSLVFAQTSGQWSPDERVPGYLDETFTPYLLADQNRTVHAFANQLVGDPNPQLAIVYRQWRLASGWTTPIDILLAPGGAQIIGAFLDAQGMMHVAFWGGDAQAANIYYSRAPATGAGRAPAWLRPIPVGEGALSPASGALAGDNQGNLVIIYSGNSAGNGVYALISDDNGDHWSKAAPIFLTYDGKLSPFSLKIYVDAIGQQHAVWNVVTDKGVDQSLYYARLKAIHQQWSTPLMLDERIESVDFFGPSFPSITGYDDTVVVMFNSGNPSIDGPVDVGRPVQRVRLSTDGGDTWEAAISPFPRHLGRSGEHSLVIDSNQAIHAIFMQRVEAVIDGKNSVTLGPWYSILQGGQWREPDKFPVTWEPHDMRAVVSQGNVLLAVWRGDPGSGEHGVWYSYRMLDAPELPATPVPTVVVTPTGSAHLLTPTVQPRATPSPTHIAIPTNNIKRTSDRNPVGLLLFAAAPVLLLFAGLLLVRQWSRRCKLQ